MCIRDRFDAATKDRGFFVFDRKSDLEYIMPIEKGCVSPERHVLKLNMGCGYTSGRWSRGDGAALPEPETTFS